MRQLSLPPTGGAAPCLRVSARLLVPAIAACAAFSVGAGGAGAHSDHAASPQGQGVSPQLVQKVLPVHAAERARDVQLLREESLSPSVAAPGTATTTTTVTQSRAAVLSAGSTLQPSDFSALVPSLTLALPGNGNGNGLGNGNGGNSGGHSHHLAVAAAFTTPATGTARTMRRTGIGTAFGAFLGRGGTTAPATQPATAAPAPRSWPPTVLVPPASLPAPGFGGGAPVESIVSVLVAVVVIALLLTGLVLRRTVRRIG